MSKKSRIPAATAILKKAELPSYDELHASLKREGLKLQSFQSRETFLLAWPIAQAASKNFASIAGLMFAGSLTFLGLGNKVFIEVINLQIAWVALAVSILMHLLVYLAALDSYMSHGRTEVSTKKAQDLLKEGKHRELIEALLESVRGHWNQRVFFRSNWYLVIALILQVLSLMAAGWYMVVFVINNLK